jgi:hypothetical protein
MNTENAFALIRDQELTEAEVRDVLARYTRPRPRRRIAVIAGAAAALAVGTAVTVLPGGPGERLVEPASAAQRAAAVLAGTPGSIVHVSMAVEQRNPDGSHSSWRTESWQQTTPPYDLRQITTGESGATVETATVGGNRQLYDARSNTVHVAPSDRAPGAMTETATPSPATAEPLREQVLGLLRRGKLTESGRSTVLGRETVSFLWNDGQTRYEYTVEAGTYVPVRWRFSPADAGTETTVTFDTYEILSADQAPLDLTRHHPDATVRDQQ